VTQWIIRLVIEPEPPIEHFGPWRALPVELDTLTEVEESPPQLNGKTNGKERPQQLEYLDLGPAWGFQKRDEDL
jgi:hypothetical protein